MKEIRLTLGASDFGTISQMLIDMGVSFRVEPLDDTPARAASTRAESTPAVPRRQLGKKSGKAAVKRTPKRDDVTLSGADRLRKAIALKQGGGSPASASPPRPPAPGQASEPYRPISPGEEGA